MKRQVQRSDLVLQRNRKGGSKAASIKRQSVPKSVSDGRLISAEREKERCEVTVCLLVESWQKTLGATK